MPGHWRSHPDFADSDGPLLYRRRYAHGRPPEGRRRWITLDGIFYQADVWLDGAYLGDPEGYFFPHTFDITALSRIGDEHVVAIEVACPPQRSHRGRRTITGVFQHWDGIDRDWNPGGIWRPVHVYDTGPVRIDRFRVLCRDADETRAHVLLSARLDSDGRAAVTLRTLVDGVVVVGRGAAPRRRTQRGQLDPRHRRPAAVVAAGARRPAAHHDRRRGRRRRRVQRSALTPHRAARTSRGTTGRARSTASACSSRAPTCCRHGIALGEATPSDDAGATSSSRSRPGSTPLRVHGHIADPATYDAADELGVLLLQDFPLQWGYARSVRGAGRHARRAPPSTCSGTTRRSCSGTPTTNRPRWRSGSRATATASRLRYIAAHQLPSWNKTVLDRWVKRSIERADPTRLVVPHSGVLPHFPMLDGTDSHFYFGWYHGDVRDIERARRGACPAWCDSCRSSAPSRCPRPPTSSTPTTGPISTGTRSAMHHGLQKWVFDERVPPADFATFDEWRHATQTLPSRADPASHRGAAPAQVPAGRRVLHVRPQRPRTRGVVQRARPRPRRRSRPGTRCGEACRPVIVVADRPPSIVTAGDALDARRARRQRPAPRRSTRPSSTSSPAGPAASSGGGSAERSAPTNASRSAESSSTCPTRSGALTFDLTLTAGDDHGDQPLRLGRHRRAGARIVTLATRSGRPRLTDTTRGARPRDSFLRFLNFDLR